MALLVLVQCATSGSGTDPVRAGGSYDLLIYSAPWCENCEPFIKDIGAQLAGQSKGASSRLTPMIHVVTGQQKPKRPTPEVAAAYADKLAVGIPAIADFWRDGTYGSYYGTESLNIPAVVILSREGDAPKIFPAGTQSAEVMAYLDSILH